MAERSRARVDQRRRPARPCGQLLRPAATRLVRSDPRSDYESTARAEDDRGGALYAPPLHGLQPAAPDLGTSVASAIHWSARNGRATVRGWSEVLSSEFTIHATDSAAAIPTAGAGGPHWDERSSGGSRAATSAYITRVGARPSGNARDPRRRDAGHRRRSASEARRSLGQASRALGFVSIIPHGSRTSRKPLRPSCRGRDSKPLRLQRRHLILSSLGLQTRRDPARVFPC